MPDACAAQRLFHKRLVRLDVAKQDRDAIEWRALSGKRANAAGDFDALETFAGGGEEQRRVGRGGRRRLGRKEPGPDAIERFGGWRSIDIFRRHAEDSFEGLNCVIASCGCSQDAGRLFDERGEQPLMGGGFHGQAEQNQGQAREAVVVLCGFGFGFGFFSGEPKEHRQIGERTRGELLFVKRKEMREVGRRSGVLQAQFGDGFGERAGEARCLSYGGKVGETFRGYGGVNDARRNRFDTQPGDGSERETSHRLRGEMGGELRDGECVNALATGWESADNELSRGGSCGRDDEDFRMLGLIGEERSGTAEERGIRAGMNERARDHRQLYWVENLQRAGTAITSSPSAASREGRASTGRTVERRAPPD